MPWVEYYISLNKPNVQMYEEQSIEFGKELNVARVKAWKYLHKIYFDSNRKLHMNTGEQNLSPRRKAIKWYSLSMCYASD